MNATGKFYIWLNQGAVVSPHLYWSQHAQNWTRNPHEATLFDRREMAEVEAQFARMTTPAEPVVLQATRDPK